MRCALCADVYVNQASDGQATSYVQYIAVVEPPLVEWLQVTTHSEAFVSFTGI